MKRPVVYWILRIPFYCPANFPSIYIDRSHFKGPVHSNIEQFRHSNKRFMKGYTKLKVAVVLALQSQWIPIWIPLKFAFRTEFQGMVLLYIGYSLIYWLWWLMRDIWNNGENFFWKKKMKISYRWWEKGGRSQQGKIEKYDNLYGLAGYPT